MMRDGEEIEPPICAQCKRPVDRMRVSHDIVRDRFVFLIGCHGQVQKFEVDAEMFYAAGRIHYGEAFTENREPDPKLAVRANRLELTEGS